ncbi:MAG: hypothetical protein ABTD50_02870 [Polyangiaceae bacterium]|jgi:hypothetical protein
MRTRKYAHEALATLRDLRADQALARLATAIGQRVSAERALLECEQRRTAYDANVARLGATEASELAHGRLRAADLARANAWNLRVSTEREALEAERTRALARQRAAADAERGAHDKAIACLGDARLVQEDRQRWTERVRALAEAAEDEARAETWRRPQ